jgi:hypothetical protein
MRTTRRPRRYIAEQLLVLMTPAFRYSRSRDAWVLRVVGSKTGPVLRIDRRVAQRPFRGAERRQSAARHDRTRVA